MKSTPSWNAFAVVDGILTDHRVDDEQHLVGVGRLADVGGLLHHLGVDTETTGGVDDDDVVLLVAWRTSRASLATLTGLPTPLPGSGANTGTPACSPTTCSWVTAFGRWRSAATRIGVWSSLREPLRQLAGERGLTGTLEAGEHDHRRRVLRELEAALLAAEDAHELLVDDLHDLLRGVERLVDLVAEGAFAHGAR